MTPQEIITQAEQSGVHLWLESGGIRFSGGPSRSLLSLLRQHKPAILNALTAAESAPTPTPRPQASSPTAATTAAPSIEDGIIGRRDDGTPLMRQGIPTLNGWLTESEAEESKQECLTRHLMKNHGTAHNMKKRHGAEWVNAMRARMKAAR